MSTGKRATPNLEAIFALQLRATGMPPHVTEHVFHPTRMWRFDFAWVDLKVAVEIDGGTVGMRGRHVRAEGFRNDCLKLSEAALHGWLVLRGDSVMVKNGSLLALAERAVRGVGHEANTISFCTGGLVRPEANQPRGIAREEAQSGSAGAGTASGVSVACGKGKGKAGGRVTRGMR